jgi:hypothetical protein
MTILMWVILCAGWSVLAYEHRRGLRDLTVVEATLMWAALSIATASALTQLGGAA